MAESVVSIPVALNSSVALECDVLDAKPLPQIKWFDDQGEIQEVREGNSVRFLDGGRYLYLKLFICSDSITVLLPMPN